jgi:hypothetical protein
MVAHKIYPMVNTYTNLPDGDFRKGWPRITEVSHEPKLIKLFEKQLPRFKPNSPFIFGAGKAYAEHSGIALLSEYALFGNPDPGENLSFHSAFTLKKPLKQKRVQNLKYDPDKKYIAFVGSDGDNLGMLIDSLRTIWNAPGHGKIPYSHTLSAAISVLMPRVAEHLYASASPNDYFVGGCSGIGYTKTEYWGLAYPAEKRQKLWEAYCRVNAEAMIILDMKEFCPLNTSEKTRFIMTRCQKGLNALFVDFAPAEKYVEANQIVNGIPVFRGIVGPWGSEAPGDDSFKEPEQIARDIMEKTGKVRGAVASAGLNGWWATPKFLKKLTALLKGYQIVPSYELAGLLIQSYKKY